MTMYGAAIHRAFGSAVNWCTRMLLQWVPPVGPPSG